MVVEVMRINQEGKCKTEYGLDKQKITESVQTAKFTKPIQIA